MIAFYWPGTTGEWLAFAVAVITVGFGVLLFSAPRLSFRILRLETANAHPDAIAEGRATMAGFYLGCGLCCILLAQPLIYLALGASWAFTALGRLVSILFDGAATRFNVLSTLFEAVLAILPLAFVFGLI
ncbi:DUF4345 family protein [Hoeflea prorocentri]|uniref:DUF4345 family protein n=1 Tax=Hoeflea prorocentri TaxID=1922333 RepID=A0A9X3ZJT8_9HYPH|nr:DUF4345 family protein [Hoeflea prorocentri]MCY6383443.1 DUF4345 family protein [Hoeflea prorocentri]MDA5401243.1 DUF4345 family protein [Hoeflea prorocentri]